MQFMLSNLHCRGDERNILDCPRKVEYGIDEYTDDIGVECTNDTNYKSGKSLFEHLFIIKIKARSKLYLVPSPGKFRRSLGVGRQSKCWVVQALRWAVERNRNARW